MKKFIFGSLLVVALAIPVVAKANDWALYGFSSFGACYSSFYNSFRGDGLNAGSAAYGAASICL